MGTLLQITGCIPAFSTRGKGALRPLLSVLVGVSKREHLLQILLKAALCLLAISMRIVPFICSACCSFSMSRHTQEKKLTKTKGYLIKSGTNFHRQTEKLHFYL